MILATSLECLLLFVCATSSDLRTRIVGCCIWCAYFYYSATRVSLARLAQWLHDRNNPPGGTA